LFLSLDGVAEAPNEWQGDVWDGIMGDAMNAMLDKQDAMLLGRVTYQEWAGYWPTSTDEPFATYINTIPKYVVSTTLDKVDWQNSSLLKGDLASAIAELKQQPGGTIGVSGSPTLVESLLQADLLDELVLMIHPVVVGKGKRLFNDGKALKRLKLVDAKTSSTGVVIATYRPDRAS
jgi:dihydrofolate reductase